MTAGQPRFSLQNPTSFGYNVVDLILALHSTKTAGELEAAA